MQDARLFSAVADMVRLRPDEAGRRFSAEIVSSRFAFAREEKIFGRENRFGKMESNETVECDDYDDDVLLYYNKLIEVNCENVKKVTVNYMESEGLHVDN